MPSQLQNKTTVYTRLQWVLAGALVLFAAGFYFLTYRPSRTEHAQLSGQLQQTRAELSAARARATDLPRIAAENDALSLRLAQSKRLSRHQEMGDIVRDISRLGNQFSLRRFSYKYGLARRTDDYSQLPIDLEFEGDMMNVYSFLKQTEDLPRLTRLRSLTLTPTERPGVVTAKVSFNTFFSVDQ